MSKKRKISDEHRTFNKSWTDLFFFIENKSKLLKSIMLNVTMKQEYKLKFDTLAGDLGEIKINTFKSSLNN